jgi:two-component system response regulator
MTAAAKPVEILLVEDSTDDAEIAIRALRRNNLANGIVHVKDGQAALDFLFNTTAAPPRLILLDLQMPKIGGLEVLKRLRADPRTRSITVVILTSSKEEPDVQASYSLGANSYIVKPVDFDKFQEAIATLGLYWVVLNQPPH